MDTLTVDDVTEQPTRIIHLGARQIPVARYSPNELKEELAAFG